jgi:hypothetical protein
LLVKCVGHHGRAEQELHGASRHPELDLIERFFFDEVALLNVDAVNAGLERADYHQPGDGE